MPTEREREREREKILGEFAPVLAQKITSEWSAADQITTMSLAGEVPPLIIPLPMLELRHKEDRT